MSTSVWAVVALDRGSGLGPPHQLGRRGLAQRLLERLAHRVEGVLGAVDLVRTVLSLAAHHVLGAGVDRLLHDVVGRAGLERVTELAHAVEHEGDRVGLAEIAAVLGEDRAHLAGGAIAVVGQRLDDHRHAARAVALVAHLVVVGVGLAARPALDRPIDRVARHVGVACRDHRRPQPRVRRRIGGTQPGSRRDLADQLGVDLRLGRVLPALAMHDVLELGMASHSPDNQIE